MKLFKKSFLILVILFAVALLPRFYHLSQTTIYPDEISWMVRGKETIYALAKLNFNYFNAIWWTDPKEHEAIALPLTISSATSLIILGKNPSSLSLHMFPDYTAARIPVAIISSLLIPSFYLLAKRFINSKIAFLFAILLALDPIHLALSRWVMNDGLLTLFTFLTIYFFLIYQKKTIHLILISFTLAAASLTRPTSVITIIPLAILSLTKTKKTSQSLVLLCKILLFTYLLVWILWPGLWTHPLTSYVEYFFREATLAQQGIKVFYMGKVTTNPSLTYYFFQLATRLPLFILILFLLSPIFLIIKIMSKQITTKKIKNYLPQVAFIVFALTFFLALSFSALKIGVRYALPIWPWIYLAAAWSTSQIFLFIKQKSLRFILVSALLIAAVLNLLIYFPNYYLFYNSLIKGPEGAQNYDLVGHCLGSKPALGYIQSCYPEVQSVAILGCSGVTAPYYFAHPVSDDWQNATVTVIDYTYKQLLSNKEILDYFGKQKPIFTAKYYGAIMSEVYSKTPPKKNCSQQF